MGLSCLFALWGTKIIISSLETIIFFVLYIFLSGDEEGKDGGLGNVVDLIQCYQQSQRHRAVQIQLQPILDHLFEREQAGGTLKLKRRVITYPTSFLWQVRNMFGIRSQVVDRQ